LAEALDERIMEAAIEQTLASLRAGEETHLDRRTPIERELSVIEAQERNLEEAIKCGEAPDPLIAALKGEEARKANLTRELADLADLARVASLDTERVKRDIRARAADVKGFLNQHRQAPKVRQMLRKLVVDRL
jgi:hypothetical protein